MGGPARRLSESRLDLVTSVDWSNVADRRVIANLDGPDPDCRSPVQPLQRVLARVRRGLFLRGGAPGDVAAGPSPVNATSPHLPAVVFERVSLAFDENVVLRDVSFSVPPGGMKVILGGSGAGKSVILKLILGLLKPDAGVIRVHGARVDTMTEAQLMKVRADIGMLFQEGALFDSLTVADNVGYRLDEEIRMPVDQVRRRVEEVLGFIGLDEYVDRLPSELSGGQRRRVAIARAMAARPRLLLLDEPTSGLDPITARSVDNEIIKFRDLEHVTSILVTHQLNDVFYVATHEAVQSNGRPSIRLADARKAAETEFMMIKDGVIQFEGSAAALRASGDPYLKKFIS